MQKTPSQTVPAPQPQTPAYQKPEVKALGAWQAVTLVLSVPMGPGGQVLPGQSQDF